MMAPIRKDDYLVRAAADSDDMAHVRRLIQAYLAELQIDLCFQGVDAELAGLPGDYAPPTGACFLAFAPNDLAGEDPIGMVALRKMEDGICEMKRLYVSKAHRTGGLGRVLCQTILDQARELGYHTMKLDTLKRLAAAVTLYQRLGFVPTARYNDNPYDDILYLEIAL